MARPNFCFIDHSSNVENNLDGTRLAEMKSNQGINKEVQVKNDYSWCTVDNSRKNEKDIDGLKDRMSPNVYLNVGNEVERGIQNGSQLSGWIPAK